MALRGRGRRIVIGGAVAGAITMGLAAGGVAYGNAGVVRHGVPPNCTGSPSTSICTLTVAWPPGEIATSVLPFDSPGNFTQVNTTDFQNLMYRPLYWYGLGASLSVQNLLSPANYPPASTVINGGTQSKVTITLKPWNFSDGVGQTEAVNGQSVKLWLDMDKAVGAAHYGGYSPGFGIPDSLTDVTAAGQTVTLTFDDQVNPTWLAENYLSEIVPLPLAWDATSLAGPGSIPGSGGCGAASWSNLNNLDSKCAAVWTFLNAQNSATSSYATSSLWRWVDGPYRLEAFGISGGLPDGNDTLFPNTGYNGPQPSLVGRVDYVPYVTVTAEENDVASNSIDIGYADPSYLPAATPGPCLAGANAAPVTAHYTLSSSCTWAFSYASYNLSGSGTAAAELNQLYVREALQEGIDQPSIIQHIYKGYAVPTVNPVPLYPATYQGGLTNPYPFSNAAAITLLGHNGWTMVGGVETCTMPGTGLGECGAGIAPSSTLTFTYTYPTGNAETSAEVNAEIASWATEGITVTANPLAPGAVAAFCSSGASTWDLCQNNEWWYNPDVFPSDELLIATGNPGGLVTMDLMSLIGGTTIGPADLDPNSVQGPPSPATSLAQYEGENLTFMYQPTPSQIIETSKQVSGSQPPNELGDFMPEYDYK